MEVIVSMRTHPRFCRPLACLIAVALLCGMTLPGFAEQRVVLREGRSVKVKFPEKLEVKEMPADGVFRGEILESVRESGEKVLLYGGEVVFELGEVESPGRLGKGGKVEIQNIKAIAVDGSEIPLRPVFKRKGGGKRILALLLLPVIFIGFFIKGKPATFKAGEVLTFKVAADSEVLVD